MVIDLPAFGANGSFLAGFHAALFATSLILLAGGLLSFTFIGSDKQ